MASEIITADEAGRIHDTLRYGLLQSIAAKFSSPDQLYKLPEEEIVLAAEGDNQFMPTEYVGYLSFDRVYVTSNYYTGQYSSCSYQDLYTIELVRILKALEQDNGQWVNKKINSLMAETY